MRDGAAVNTGRTMQVLISGASFAGLAMAWWMQQQGHKVTLVEIAPGLRKGGTPVDIREGGVIDVVRRMGLLERIKACSLPLRPMAFLDREGAPFARMPGEVAAAEGERVEWEIERDDLLDLLFEQVEGEVEMLFGESITQVDESADEVAVVFAGGTRRSFDLLLGCDGTHSAVRRLCFGEESRFLMYLQNYFSLTIVDRLLLPEDTSQMFNLPGKTVMLNAYHGKTDIAFCFFSEEEIDYDRRDRESQKRMILDCFEGVGWRVPELLEAMLGSDNFYFDKLCQIRMPSWVRARVALVGDAGYCPSPAAGMGGSMALLGAAALADALAKHPDDHERAFQAYDEGLRPEVEEIQRNAIEFGLKLFAPTTAEAIEERNAQLQLSSAGAAV